MPKKVKDKWVRALRSGKYKQATGTLYDPATKGFCCLGVLEHVMMNGEVEINPDTRNSDDSPRYLGQPTKEFWDKIGACNDKEAIFAPHVGYCQTVSELMEMNDGNRDDYDESEDEYNAPMSFAQIADYIEHEIAGLR
jgi:hypothetical protein